MHPDPGDKVLDVKDGNQVSSPRTLAVQLGAPIQRLLIFTGIAIPEWDSQGNLDRKRVWVNLGVFPKRMFAHTAVAGLAAIGAGSEGFAMGTDRVWVEHRDDTGELALVCDIGVAGKPGWLHRFGYQASVIVGVEDPLIAGTIRWRPSLTQLLRQTNLFSVIGHTAQATGTPGSGGFGTTVVHDVGHGGETDRPTQTGGFFVVPYLLTGDLPMNVDITVAPSAVAGAFAAAPDQLAFNQIAGPRPVRLTPSSPQMFGVDFEMVPKGGVA